jgi:hypothetical protein
MPESGQDQAIVAVGKVQSSLPAPQLDVVETQTRAVGVIMPPHHIRQIVDKTAEFVAKNGMPTRINFWRLWRLGISDLGICDDGH